MYSLFQEYYHPDCLKCEICEKKLEKYRTWGGLLRCAEHASTEVELICDMCEEEIPTPSEAVAASGMLCVEICCDLSVKFSLRVVLLHTVFI